MSNECHIRAQIKIRPGAEDQAATRVEKFVSDKQLPDNKVQELVAGQGRLALYIDLYGHGDRHDDDVAALAKDLAVIAAEPGHIEFFDDETPSTEGPTIYWVGPSEEERRSARIRYGIERMRDFVHTSDFANGALDKFTTNLMDSTHTKPEAAAPTFNFMHQAGLVADLLSAAVEALPQLGGTMRHKLERAMRGFESAATLTTWSTEDIAESEEENATMSHAELLQALWRFAKHADITETDWMRMENAADFVRSERPEGARFLRVTLADGAERRVPVDAIQAVIVECGGDLISAACEVLGIDDVSGVQVHASVHYDAEGKSLD